MFPLWWIGVKWVPSGSSKSKFSFAQKLQNLILSLSIIAFLPAMINSFVHVIMYMYYALAAMGPSVAKYLWWKRYLTIIQLIQFTIAMTASAVALYHGCDFPLWMHYLLIVYMVTFLVLFGNFYMQSYLEKGKSGKRLKESQRAQNELITNNLGLDPTAKIIERDFILGEQREGKKIN